MSEHEKREEIGKLVEEYSHHRGELNHVAAKLESARQDYQIASSAQLFSQLKAQDGKLIFPQNMRAFGIQGPPPQLEGLLNHHDLVEAIAEKQRLDEETGKLADRLRALAPHLL